MVTIRSWLLNAQRLGMIGMQCWLLMDGIRRIKVRLDILAHRLLELLMKVIMVAMPCFIGLILLRPRTSLAKKLLWLL